MSLDRDHPALGGGVSAAALAIALADAWRPDEAMTTSGGRELDVAAVRRRAEMGSTGERTMAGVLLSLYGEQAVDLSRLDALDRSARVLLADGLALLAGRAIT